jgi:hypothetical protein
MVIGHLVKNFTEMVAELERSYFLKHGVTGFPHTESPVKRDV